MSIFGKKEPQDSSGQETAYARQNRVRTTVMIRLLAAGYILYLLYSTMRMYVEGGAEAPTVPVLLLSILVLGGGGIFLLILAWKEYKRGQQEVQELKNAEKLAALEDTEEQKQDSHSSCEEEETEEESAP